MKLSSNNVCQYLSDVGIVSKKDIGIITIEPQLSNSWLVLLQSNHKLIVKQKHYLQDNNTNNIILKEYVLNQFLSFSKDLDYARSLTLEVIHFDEINSVIIYSVRDYIHLEDYYKSQESFSSTTIAKLVGTTLAVLHLETLKSQDCYNFMNDNVEGKFSYQFPYPIYLQDRLDAETFFTLPPEAYNFIGLYQRFENLKAAVKELVFSHTHYCLTHNNLRTSNILIPSQGINILSQAENSKQSIIRLINWESSSWGDPASDLGAAIAGYLLFWLNSLIVHPAIELEKSLQLSTVPLESIQPLIVALTRAYISNFPEILEDCPDFLKRLVQFTGLSLIYSVLALIDSFQGFNNQSLCRLQLAKNLICKPEKSFISVFGMTESALVDFKNFS
jgi:hypothetical protein